MYYVGGQCWNWSNDQNSISSTHPAAGGEDTHAPHCLHIITSPSQDVTNTTNIKLSPLPPPIHHNHHQHECHLYKYHRYRPPPPLLQKYGNGMNECDNKTRCPNESNMLTIKRIQTGPPSEKYVPCVHFTTHFTVVYTVCCK